jgi:hypothetical protein
MALSLSGWLSSNNKVSIAPLSSSCSLLQHGERVFGRKVIRQSSSEEPAAPKMGLFSWFSKVKAPLTPHISLANVILNPCSPPSQITRPSSPNSPRTSTMPRSTSPRSACASAASHSW